MTRSTRKTVAASALIAGAAMVAAVLPSGVATAGTSSQTPVKAQARAGALPVQLSPSQRGELLTAANASRAVTARSLHLGSKEALIVKSVLKDADGSLHTR
ncbi:peptidase M4, partial [Streptomyces sp. NPDC051020]